LFKVDVVRRRRSKRSSGNHTNRERIFSDYVDRTGDEFFLLWQRGSENW
jgi:hypothetical protein